MPRVIVGTGAAEKPIRVIHCVQAEEQPMSASGQRSKAATKRARKKAAKQQAADAAASRAQVANTAALAAAVTPSPARQAAVTSRCSTPGTEDAQLEESPAVQARVGSLRDDSGASEVPLQSTAADHMPAAQSDWWRCPLSGRVMRDPVLYGSSGHSFEREALEEWAAANPGVQPLSREPMPPGSSAVLSNHALRNMIQQLRLG
jgi:U-box domain